jgi:FMN phosphatase YigB (HAD superfamily)
MMPARWIEFWCFLNTDPVLFPDWTAVWPGSTATYTHLRQRARSHNGGTISLDRIDHLIGQKPVDPAAAAALRVLHDDLGMRLVLASNTQPGETRWPALQQAGIDQLFTAAFLSYPLGVRKPATLFYDLVLAAAGCLASEVLFVGNHLENDVTAPARHGIRTALVRPLGLRDGEVLPDGALLISHVRELPSLLEAE